MILKQTGTDVQPGCFNQGVLTATNSRLFPAVHATAISLKEQRLKYAVVDHGLTGEQIDILHSLNVMVFDDLPMRIVTGMTRSEVYPEIPVQAWRKPYLIVNSPFRLTAWIDADAIPLHHAQELFSWPKGIITQDHFIDREWAEENYRPLLDAMGLQTLHPLNAGVLVAPKDADWLQKWAKATWSIITSTTWSALAHCRDQSALIVALSNMRSTEMPAYLTQAHWNYPADGCRNLQMWNRLRDYPKDGQMLLDFARDRHPGVTVVHWMGPIKPWALDQK